MLDVAAAAASPRQRSPLFGISEKIQRLLRIVADFFENAADRI